VAVMVTSIRFATRTGTDPHHSIDWKATARSGHLMVREYTAEDDRRVIILFDYSGAGDSERPSAKPG
jgi:uncharacterized protein (DUF58 family)